MPNKNLFMCLFAVLQLLLIFCGLETTAQSLEQQKRNVTAFNKLYGYVQYFHPSDEAADLDWYAFSVYGVERMLKAKTDRAMILALNEIFNVIAPSVRVYSSTEYRNFDVSSITPSHTKAFEVVTWQHTGLHVRGYDHDIYRNVRLNRPVGLTKEDIEKKSYTLTKSIKGLKGKAFRAFVEIKSSEPLTLKAFIDPKLKGIFKEDNTIETTNQLLRYSFSGTFDVKNDAVVFAFYTDSKLNTAVNNLKLEVKDGNGYVDVPIEHSSSLYPPASDTCSKYAILAISNQIGKEKLFDKEIKMGEHLSKVLVDGINCTVPLALYGSKQYTFPRADSSAYQKLKLNITQVWPRDQAGLYDVTGAALKIRLSDLIISWNVLRHSFPYWKDASESPEQIWNKSLSKAFRDSTSDDFFATLELMCAPLNDGHMFVVDDNPPSIQKATVPILFEYVEDKIVVKKVQDISLVAKIRLGDELKAIDEKNAMELLEEYESHYSGSPQWKRKKCLLSFINGSRGGASRVTFTGSGGEYTLNVRRDAEIKGYVSGSERNNRKAYEWLPDSIFYINLNKTSTDKHMIDLVKARSIVIDMRGYLQEMTETFAQHLTIKKLTGNGTMSVPQILYPNDEKVNYEFGKIELNPELPYIKAKVYILQDASAQSAAETFTAYYKQFKLAKIIGEPSSGTNGDINVIELPGDYRIHYSGMLVQNPDGSRHHLNGVLPDVSIKTTVQAIKNGQDEIFDKAIALAKSEQF